MAYDGAGTLYVGGTFSQAGTVKLQNLARYANGQVRRCHSDTDDGQWSSAMTNDMENWSGAVLEILVVTAQESINFASTSSGGIFHHRNGSLISEGLICAAYEFALLISLVAAVLVIAVIFILFLGTQSFLHCCSFYMMSHAKALIYVI